MFGKEDKQDATFKLGKQVFRQDELEIPITYREEIFTLKYPTPFLRAQIEADIARRLGGLSRDAYPPEHLAMMEATCYVDALAISDKCPDWFVSAHTCYDDELIANLYAGYLRFRDKFRSRVRKGQSEGSGKGDGS